MYTQSQTISKWQNLTCLWGLKTHRSSFTLFKTQNFRALKCPFIIWGWGGWGREYFFKQYSLASEKLCIDIYFVNRMREQQPNIFQKQRMHLADPNSPNSISLAILYVCSNFLVWAELTGSSPEKARCIHHWLLCEKPALTQWLKIINLFSHSFCGSRIQKQLSWVVLAQGLSWDFSQNVDQE